MADDNAEDGGGEARRGAVTIGERMRRFSVAYGKDLRVGGTPWRYHRLGAGPALLWLTGGLRRAAFGFAFMEHLASRHTIIAPDYPPVRTLGALLGGFDAILRAEGVERVALVGQSYGGILAQAVVASRPGVVARLVLSSTGPADFGPAWLPVEYLAIALARVLPERPLKRLLAGGLARVLSVPERERVEWEQALRDTMNDDLTRADIVSHFAVAADMIRTRVVRPAAFAGWFGRIVVLSADNDPTQSPRDRPRFEALFGRPVEVMSLGQAGHTAAMLDPASYGLLLEQALA